MYFLRNDGGVMKVVRKDGKKFDDSPIYIILVNNIIFKAYYKLHKNLKSTSFIEDEMKSARTINLLVQNNIHPLQYIST